VSFDTPRTFVEEHKCPDSGHGGRTKDTEGDRLDGLDDGLSLIDFTQEFENERSPFAFSYLPG
jgi:hypothetical protein